MIISLIAAASENDVIGNKGKIPWSLPADLRYFRKTTEGKPIIMGRKTFESIGHPLPNRKNIVVSRTMKAPPFGCELYDDLGAALRKLLEEKNQEIFIIGGGELYLQALAKPYTWDSANRIYLTRVHTTIEGDTHFPKVDPSEWKEVSRDDSHMNEKPLGYTFFVYGRVK